MNHHKLFNQLPNTVCWVTWAEGEAAGTTAHSIHGGEDRGKGSTQGVLHAHPVSINPLSNTQFTPWIKSIGVERSDSEGWESEYYPWLCYEPVLGIS